MRSSAELIGSIAFVYSREAQMDEYPHGGIIRGGPAGAILSHLLHVARMESVVIERRTRAEVEQPIRPF